MGEWDPRTSTVRVDRTLQYDERRCTLAHELAHVDRGDVGHDPRHPDAWRYTVRDERAADALAARRLISLEALLDALLWSIDPREVAEWLDVDLATLKARTDNLTADEAEWLNREMDEREAHMP